jgi:hypothetical protein
MSANSIARLLSTQQRQCLIDHAKGPQPFKKVDDANTNGLHKTKMCLIDLNLLRSTDCHLNPRPSELELTSLGQEAVCIILARMVEVLLDAGFMNKLTAQKVSASILNASALRKEAPKCTERNMPYHVDATPMEAPAQSITRNRDATIELARRLSTGH